MDVLELRIKKLVGDDIPAEGGEAYPEEGGQLFLRPDAAFHAQHVGGASPVQGLQLGDFTMVMPAAILFGPNPADVGRRW